MITRLHRAGHAVALAAALFPCLLLSQAGPPPSNGGIFPLSQIRAGMKATAWTVFTGTKPEPMDVEILGILRGTRGPGHDMILVQLHGSHPEYTGVVEGMSGSPVYIGDKLVGALAYRIGQFTKDPIAGITPIEQMLEVRDLPVTNGGAAGLQLAARCTGGTDNKFPDDGNTAGDERIFAGSGAAVAAEDGGNRAGAGFSRRHGDKFRCG
jgi:hypothetical protein